MAVQGKQVAIQAGNRAELSAPDAKTDNRPGHTVALPGGADVDLWLGGDDTVTASGATAGCVLPAGTPLSLALDVGEELWAYAATATTVHVLRQGV